MGKVVGNAAELDDLLPGQNFHSAWTSPEALARHIQEIDRKDCWHKSAWDTDDPDWRGGASMEDAINLCLDGWKEGAEMVEKMRGLIAALRPQQYRLNRFDIVGSVPNVPRAVAGEIKNMRAYDLSKSRRKPVITLVSDMAVSWNINANRIANRAAAVTCIVDEIEAAGYSVEVLSVAMTNGHSGWMGDGEDGYKAMTTIMAKRSDYPVDIKRLAFALGHPAMFRRFAFASWGSVDELKSKLGYGLGSIGNSFDKEIANEKAIYVLPTMQECSALYEDMEIASTAGMDLLVQELKNQKCSVFLKTEVKSDFKKLAKEGLMSRDYWGPDPEEYDDND